MEKGLDVNRIASTHGLSAREVREILRLFQTVQHRIDPVLKLKPHNRAMYLFKLDLIERDMRERFNHAHANERLFKDEPHLHEMSKRMEDALVGYAMEYAEEKLKRQLPPGQATLENYCALMDSITTAARDEPGSVRELDGTPSAQARQHINGLWAALRNARIFDFPHGTYLDVYRAVDIYLTEKIVKRKWRIADEDDYEGKGGLRPEDVDEYIEKTSVAGQSVPFPDPLPFDSVYMGFDQGVMLTPQSLRLRIPDKVRRESVRYGVVLGFLLHQTSTGPMAYEISYILQEDGDNYHLPLPLTNRVGMWENPAYTLAPWLLTHFISMINEHRTIIAETKPSFALRRDFEQARKKFRMPSMIPKPYYLVRMEKKLITEHVERQHKELSRIARELSYRHVRRGHERCYVRRGKHPLAVKDSQKLHEAGYMIWTVDEPDANAYRQLMERGYPPKAADEWLAILTKWIDPQIVGPEDKPYIPAIRLPAKVD